LGRQAIDT